MEKKQVPGLEFAPFRDLFVNDGFVGNIGRRMAKRATRVEGSSPSPAGHSRPMLPLAQPSHESTSMPTPSAMGRSGTVISPRKAGSMAMGESAITHPTLCSPAGQIST